MFGKSLCLSSEPLGLDLILLSRQSLLNSISFIFLIPCYLTDYYSHLILILASHINIH